MSKNHLRTSKKKSGM